MEILDVVIREGKERLYPSLTNPSWLVLRRRRELFRKWLAGLDGNDLAVVDIGGRIQPYRPLLEGRMRSYIAVDLRQTPLVTIIARGEQVPLAGASFDLAICTQMLEYVLDPAVVVAEIHRLLKPGGCLLLSVPAIFPRDSNEDRWRFTPQQMRFLLRSFTNLEIAAEGSSISGLFRSICIFLALFLRPGFVRKLVQFTLIPALNITAASLEALFGSSNDQFAANFSALAKK